MAPGPDLLRRAALIAAAALALHELRYRAGYGGDAAAVAAGHGHAYLPWAAGVALALVVGVVCAFVVALVVEFRRMYGPEPRAGGRGGLRRSWLGHSAALALIYTAQELAEGFVAHGHPTGLEGVVGHAGWSAYLFALALGALVALALRGARAAVALAARPGRERLLPPRAARAVPRPRLSLPLPRPRVLALNLAGRAPPASC